VTLDRFYANTAALTLDTPSRLIEIDHVFNHYTVLWQAFKTLYGAGYSRCELE
jgi:hypothetical protein